MCSPPATATARAARYHVGASTNTSITRIAGAIKGGILPSQACFTVVIANDYVATGVVIVGRVMSCAGPGYKGR